MGNTSSHIQHPSKPRATANRPSAPHHPKLAHKLSCITAFPSQESLHSGSSFISDTNLSEKRAAVIQHSLVRPEDHSFEEAPELKEAFDSFVDTYPEYRQTWILDSLRRSDYTRLTRSDETYVDYMGGCLFPESLVQIHADFLSRNIMGNTHSVSNSSQTSTNLAIEARNAVLDFFKAPPGYTVIFTQNATGALKLVGESYPFCDDGAFVLGVDSHNSVNGIRRFASQAGARVVYLRSGSRGGVDLAETENVLLENRPSSSGAPCLLALTGLSNISNTKNPLEICAYAKRLGYHTVLDAAALATTSAINLTESPGIDAMCVSFYKMFGFPTGVGALIVKEDFLRTLHRPWFAGGTVDVVQVPGSLVTMASDLTEHFQDGTINYLSLPAVTHGLRFLTMYMPFLPMRLSALTHYLVAGLEGLRHDVNGSRVARILSRLPTRRLREIGDQANFGSTVSLHFLDSDGMMLPLSFIEYAAAQRRISLRTGCVCNPGGAAAIIGIESDMEQLYEGVTLRDFESRVGHELGVVRISLGLASNFVDVWRVMEFARCLSIQEERHILLKEWKKSGRGHGLH
ncbi:PLP-dependent transferase [Fomitiporia mediterranea MF3/22]|uniref:PLP-dependent transferase n=1 Tax=Fomitiporia mediterranea (strain MF3/22) TaxID=694068 RepID=UPI0004408C54|nr:PLP-dependent transferase [Fomitiporia mediterranea MF3/22]EJD08353.1 PLP-dependent transferase [Fomitiporia mediterranea MF3/22]